MHATRMRCIVLSSVTNLALPYFPALSHKGHDFRAKSFTEYGICFVIFSTTFLSLSKELNEVCKGLRVKYPQCLSDF